MRKRKRLPVVLSISQPHCRRNLTEVTRCGYSDGKLSVYMTRPEDSRTMTLPNPSSPFVERGPEASSKTIST